MHKYVSGPASTTLKIERAPVLGLAKPESRPSKSLREHKSEGTRSNFDGREIY